MSNPQNEADEPENQEVEDPGRRARSVRYGVAIFVLSVVIVGMCSVVAEALVPRALPPEDARGWIALLLAMLLFSLVAAAAAVAGYLEAISRVLARRSFWERLAMLRGRTGRVLLAAVFFAAIAVTVAQVADLGKLVKDSKLGGLDLARYCKSYGYASNDANRCRSDVAIAEACNWQYREPGHTYVQPGGPFTISCINSKGQDVGGIANMDGYCHHRFRMSADVEVALAGGKTWACQTVIDKSLACSWQYQKRDLAARKNGFLWTCYQ